MRPCIFVSAERGRAINASRVLSRNLVQNVVVILLFTHVLALLVGVVLGYFDAFEAGGSGMARPSRVFFKSAYTLFFDGSGSVYTVLIGILAAGITLFSQTGVTVTQNPTISEFQFKYFDVMSFVFNLFAALLGAILMQAILIEQLVGTPADPFGVSFVGASVVWLTCSLVAPANAALRKVASGNVPQLNDQLTTCKGAVNDLDHRLRGRSDTRGVRALPLLSFLVVASVVMLSQTDWFRVGGGTRPLHPLWIGVVLGLIILASLALVLLVDTHSDIAVSKLSDDNRGRIVNIGLFAYLAFVVGLTILAGSLAVIGATERVGSGIVVWFYLAVFGFGPTLCVLFFGGASRFYWSSVRKKLRRKIEGLERELLLLEEVGVGERPHTSGYL